MQISADSIIQRNKDIISSEIDGETVMMDSSFNNYFGLKEVGTFIWQLLEEKRSVREICETLIDKYDVSHGQCLEDILPFLEELHKQQMIEVKD